MYDVCLCVCVAVDVMVFTVVDGPPELLPSALLTHSLPQVVGETYFFCSDNEAGGLVSVAELIAALKSMPTREGLLEESAS